MDDSWQAYTKLIPSHFGICFLLLMFKKSEETTFLGEVGEGPRLMKLIRLKPAFFRGISINFFSLFWVVKEMCEIPQGIPIYDENRVEKFN